MKNYLKLLLFIILPVLFIAAGYEEEGEGPDGERRYFEHWNYPRGSELDPQFLNSTWEQIKKLPSENDVDESINTWRLIGPYGSVHVNSGARFSGRVLDIEVGNSVNPVIASASGGLWSYFGFLPFCVTENLNSLVCGSFCTKPGDANTILLGSGEPSVRSGTGLWRSTNSGVNWTKIDLSTEPSGFYKIRFINNSTVNVGAATTAGYYRSTNTGLNWTKTLTGNISDFAVNPSNSQIIYAGMRNDGIYKSTNN